MTELKVVVCDDETDAATDWIRSMTESAGQAGVQLSISRLTGPELSDEFRALEGLQAAARNGASSPGSTLDTYDIVVVDYDLIGLRPVETGETLAYLARCYSNCSYIVGLNQYPGDFDLTLRGHLASFSDLNLRGEHLGQVGLWNGQSAEGEFTPWQWPALSAEPSRLTRLVDWGVEHLSDTVLGALQLDHDYELSRFTERQLEFLSPGDPLAATFRDFAAASGNGFRQLDAALDDRGIARVAVARLVKWLEESVAPSQDIVMDAPHGADAYPSLVSGLSPTDLNADNDRRETPEWVTPLSSAAVLDGWHSRPRWRNRVLATLELPENTDPWSTEKREDLIFCEDTSRFESSGQAFRADVTGLRTRYVRKLDGLEYRPESRLVS